MAGGIYDNTKLIIANNIRQEFSVLDEKISVLKDVNFTIGANTFNIIFGPSGSGKSTLLNILAGLQKPSGGALTVEGRDIYDSSPDALAHHRANRVGFVHQTNHWIHSLNVLENVSLPLNFLGYSRTKAEKIAMVSLERVHMGAFAKKLPFNLSGGEQQRIAMARALVNDPLFIIADEPTGNLDTENGDMIMDLLLNAQSEFRRTIILVTHNMEYISLADHLLRIHDGQVEDIAQNDTEKVSEMLLKDVKDRITYLAEVKRRAITKE